LSLLARRDHARAELIRKLVTAGHSPEEIELALTRLSALGYLDDERFAHLRIRSLVASGKLGRAAIAAKLRQAGVPQDILQRALESELEGIDENATIEALIERRFPDLRRSGDAKQKARAARFLAGRGFSSAAIQRAIRFERFDVDEVDDA
jgi:regulatory protein